MSQFSRRSRLDTHENALTRALRAHHAERRPLLHLAESNPTCVGLAWDGTELANLLAQPGARSYAPDPFGLPSARSAVASTLLQGGFDVPPAQIMLTASTSEAYAYLFKLLCDPGDSVLVPSPSYPLFEMLAALEEVKLVPYQLAYDGEWHLDLDSVRRAALPTTRAILLVHPNNPTGSYLKCDELQRLADFGLPLISDEVFAEYALRDDANRAGSALEVSARILVFRMGGLSKSLLLPQLKLAWTAISGPEPQVRAACDRLAHIADTYLSVGTAVQLALPKLLLRAAEVQGHLKARLVQNLRFLRARFENSAVSVLDVEGGWYAILRLPAVLDDESWALAFLQQESVLVQPGFFYDLSHATCVVLSLIAEEAVFREGVQRIGRVVEREACG